MSETLQPSEKVMEQSSKIDHTFSSQISSAALVSVLIRKGVVSAAELLEEERRLRAANRSEHAPIEGEHSHHHSRLKRWASKRRWSRRLTHFLFGWEFKRVRVESHKNKETGDRD
ncbi:MAG: hypothetical protein ONB24_06340 [candidate division KSB1 bacterium]|nr:hypothetical protein [candidate division KSB1 bacterium]